MKALRFAFLLAAFALVLPSPPGGAQASAVIRVGVNPGDAYAEAHYAQELGLFRKAGIRADITAFSSGIAIATALSSGAIDVGVSNAVYLAKEAASGEPIVFLAGDGLYTAQAPIIALCVARNSPLRTPKDLEGKTIAITRRGDQSEVAIDAWMDTAGARYTTLRFIEIPFAEMHAALQRGLADAAINTEPWLTVAKKSGDVRILGKPYDAIGSPLYIGVWFSTAAWNTKNPALAQRFATVIYEAARWANAHRDQTARMLARFSKIDLETIESMTRTPFATNLDPAVLQRQLDVAYRYRVLDHPVDAAGLIAK